MTEMAAGDSFGGDVGQEHGEERADENGEEWLEAGDERYEHEGREQGGEIEENAGDGGDALVCQGIEE